MTFRVPGLVSLVSMVLVAPNASRARSHFSFVSQLLILLGLSGSFIVCSIFDFFIIFVLAQIIKLF